MKIWHCSTSPQCTDRGNNSLQVTGVPQPLTIYCQWKCWVFADRQSITALEAPWRPSSLDEVCYSFGAAVEAIKHGCVYKGTNASPKQEDKTDYLQWSCNLLKIPRLPAPHPLQILSTDIGRYSWYQAGSADHSSVQVLGKRQTVHPGPRYCQIYIPKKIRLSSSPQNVDQYTA